MYNLYIVKKLKTLLVFLLNICGLVTFTFDFVLDQKTTAATSFFSNPA